VSFSGNSASSILSTKSAPQQSTFRDKISRSKLSSIARFVQISLNGWSNRRWLVADRLSDSLSKLTVSKDCGQRGDSDRTQGFWAWRGCGGFGFGLVSRKFGCWWRSLVLCSLGSY
jgi:hypothetical protein